MSEKKPVVTYQMFLDAVDQLIAEGTVPTIRKVVLRVGGSNSTIQAHWEQWLQDLLAANRIGHETLSRGLLDKIVAEMDTYAAQVVETVHTRLKAALEQLSACEDEKSRVEKKAENLLEQLNSLQQDTAKRIRTLEAELEQAAGRAAAMNETAETLQEERDQAHRREREAFEAAARSRQEAETALTEARRTGTLLVDRDHELASLRERLAEAEKLGAVAEERVRQLDIVMKEQRAKIETLSEFELRAITAEARLKTPRSGEKRGNGGNRSKDVQSGQSL